MLNVVEWCDLVSVHLFGTWDYVLDKNSTTDYTKLSESTYGRKLCSFWLIQGVALRTNNEAVHSFACELDVNIVAESVQFLGEDVSVVKKISSGIDNKQNKFSGQFWKIEQLDINNTDGKKSDVEVLEPTELNYRTKE